MSDDGFTTMIDAGNAFFTELRQNNSKDWFNPRKEYYTETIKRPAELFAKLIAEDLSQMTDFDYTPKVFRIYRDVRFSKDKTPLNTHLHIMWNPTGHRFAPALFFASTPYDLSIGMGVMGLKGDDLMRYRAFIDTWGDAFEEAVTASKLTASEWGEAPLKRVPAPYAQDHPHADLLKQKKIVLGRKIPQTWRDAGIYKTLKDAFKDTAPLRDLLSKRLS